MDKNIQVADKSTQSLTRSLNYSECLGKPDSLAPLAPKESKRARQIVCGVFMTWATCPESARLEKWRAVSTTPYMGSIGDLTMFIGITLRMRLAVTPQRG